MIIRLLLLLVSLETALGHMDTKSCGVSKECVFVPTGCQESNVCRQIFTYAPKGEDWYDIELYSTNDIPKNNYVAVGFSQDDIMGEEPVTQCVFGETGNADVHISYNFGKSNAPPTQATDVALEKDHLEMIHAHKDAESMYCSFRQKSGSGAHNFYPNLRQNFTILLARGTARKPRELGIHSLDPNSPNFPFISETPVDMSILHDEPLTDEDKTPSTNDRPAPEAPAVPSNGSNAFDDSSFFTLSKPTRIWFIRVHGMLMIVAWLVLVASAILSARYLKDHWLSSSPMGLKWWFHLHRTLNMLALPLVLISALLVFWAKDFEWKGPSVAHETERNLSPGSVHSLVGTIAVLIISIQPLIALMRCAPDTGARPIFNWVHRSLGITGVVCALIAIVIAANSFRILWSDSAWSLSIALFYIVILVLTIILFEVLTYLKTKRRGDKITALEMRKHSNHRYDDTGRVVSNTLVLHRKPMLGISVLYVVFGLFAVSIAALLIIMLIA